MKTNNIKIKLAKRRLTKIGLKNMFRHEPYFKDITVKGEIEACKYLEDKEYMSDRNYLELALIIINHLINVDEVQTPTLKAYIIQTVERLLNYSFVQIDLTIK